MRDRSESSNYNSIDLSSDLHELGIGEGTIFRLMSVGCFKNLKISEKAFILLTDKKGDSMSEEDFPEVRVDFQASKIFIIFNFLHCLILNFSLH